MKPGTVNDRFETIKAAAADGDVIGKCFSDHNCQLPAVKLPID
jgi:hypothetical protein